MLHLIATPVRIRASQYAAALGLKNGAWNAYSTPETIYGARGHVHILPGCSEDLARAARANHFNQPHNDVVLIDLAGVS